MRFDQEQATEQVADRRPPQIVARVSRRSARPVLRCGGRGRRAFSTLTESAASRDGRSRDCWTAVDSGFCRLLRPITRLLPLLLLPWSGVVQAAGYYFTDAGTRALGRGTAFVAGADDLSAQYYNPAALVNLNEAQVYFSLSGVEQYVYFDRTDESGFEPFEEVYNEGPYMLIPAFSVGSKFGLRDFTFAAGMFSPFAPDLEYPQDGAQRYILIDSLLWQVGAGLSVGWHLRNWGEWDHAAWLDWISLGVTPALWNLRAENELGLAAVLNTMDEDMVGDDPQQDVDVSFKTWDLLRPSARFGLLVEPREWLSFGLSAQPPISYLGEGELNVDFSDHSWQELGLIEGDVFTDENVTMAIVVPWVVRAGVAVRPIAPLEIELDGVYEGWHVMQDVVISEMDLEIATADYLDDAVITNDIILVAGYRDAWSVRLGAEYDINDTFRGRLGGYYETSAIPDSSQGVGMVDGNKFAVMGGAGADVGSFSFDVAVARSFLADRDIDDSALTMLVLEVDMADPESSEVVNGKVVGNGHFSSHLNFLSLSATWHFGRGPGSQVQL